MSRMSGFPDTPCRSAKHRLNCTVLDYFVRRGDDSDKSIASLVEGSPLAAYIPQSQYEIPEFTSMGGTPGAQSVPQQALGVSLAAAAEAAPQGMGHRSPEVLHDILSE